MNELLIELLRIKEEREASPSVLIVDSQSVKTTEMGGEVGIDGGKKIKGRKRTIAVDSLGNPHEVVVHAANIADCVGGEMLVERLARREYPRLEVVMGDSSYAKGNMDRIVEDDLGCRLDIATRDEKTKSFVPQAIRWIVEQTFACLGRNRRLSKDYEYENGSSEAVVLIASIGRLLNRLVPKIE